MYTRAVSAGRAAGTFELGYVVWGDRKSCFVTTDVFQRIAYTCVSLFFLLWRGGGVWGKVGGVLRGVVSSCSV